MARSDGYKQLNAVKKVKAMQEAKLNGNKVAARLYSCSPSSIRLCLHDYTMMSFDINQLIDLKIGSIFETHLFSKHNSSALLHVVMQCNEMQFRNFRAIRIRVYDSNFPKYLNVGFTRSLGLILVNQPRYDQ